ncbi:bifunctional 3-(3-hydroxy-phenyl)propionate/3-hydroxycinnamic acid hydroxylase [Sphingomonas sp. AOB5]|uniref:bifunctional 3-(3-hydroxy-phenyl)propionate/3-hydroxycinnamic acid hydroxylase n=1 Tax=Sphingomonas sp. AOB5 TaxID=3034017 RepID=UPI0023F63DB3|nr:bifunctional 3-(3-hydroxy-phenyl)propionate/3-hydroxycinnamic acid hydroxylase [Sphingomonas sp. AOB5]MDF7776459.1 bifunctional 3-(3-hydroxy-phenyl)propionate/3-hydroxycinnamic acid hydroxylase [Sphingomonas sp. AOB5]
MTNHYSVAIVGAGPTGLVLANLLGKAGVRTLLVETNPATVGEPRAVSIDDESLRVMQEIGLLDTVRSEIVSGYGSEYFGPDGSLFLKVKPQAEPYGHPRRNAFRQPILEAQLRDGVRRFDHVETRFECKAEGFVELGDGVRLDLRYVNGGADSVTADFLIGCDGSWSPTREAMGYTLAGDSLAERWLIIDLEESPSESPETIVYCDPKRPGIMLPGPRRTRRYEFKLMPGETDATMLADDKVAHLLETHDGVPGARIIRKTVYHFHARIADHWGRGRVWLAGDAAHLMPPFAGQGMNGGIRDAANLGWKLAAIVSGKLGPRLLESYERERRGHVADMIRLALRMGAIFGPRTALHGLAIRASFRALGIWPAARTWFAEMKYKPAPRFDGGFLLESQLTRRGIVGRMLPQPTLGAQYGGAKLDSVLGDGFALIGVDLDPGTVEMISVGHDWDGLIARRVSLASTDAPDLAEHAGKLLLVRPDRYVMARFAPDEAAQIRPSLEALLTRTWEGTGAVPAITQPAEAAPKAEPALTAG